MSTTDDEECKWMLPMNESRSSEKACQEESEMILVASMPGTNEPAAFIRVNERLKSKKRERGRLFDERLS